MDHPAQIATIFDLIESWQRIRQKTDDGSGPDYVTGYIHGLEDALLILGISRPATAELPVAELVEATEAPSA